jgi:hypothetical protein
LTRGVGRLPVKDNDSACLDRCAEIFDYSRGMPTVIVIFLRSAGALRANPKRSGLAPDKIESHRQVALSGQDVADG